jgi:hypothetical protein
LQLGSCISDAFSIFYLVVLNKQCFLAYEFWNMFVLYGFIK